ncbi:hypothetical protein [Arsukibacterium sp.]|uniref:hypothetical protein n=1 Tax=Arsukibacterium sp. TaxID=1977258 RepID=UPI002FDAFB16
MAADQSWIMRLPQEDFCQITATSPARKYEVDGGPGISIIMQELLGAASPMHDRVSCFTHFYSIPNVDVATNQK